MVIKEVDYMLTKDALKYGREILKENNIDEREARLLLAHAMNIDVNKLITHDECTDGDFFRYEECLKRRILGEPFAYIVGEKEFMKLKFFVDKNVLVPREDTEVLVLEAIKQCRKKILDLCTGSGCIAISLAKYIQNAEIDASDISVRTLGVAKKNAISNEADVNFIKSDVFENIHDKYEMIVSNPPYIKTEDLKSLQKEVLKEPKRALDGGKSGLYFYDKILKEAKEFLTDDGVILFEIGFDQAKDVTELAKKYNYRKIKKVKDLSGNDRVLIIER